MCRCKAVAELVEEGNFKTRVVCHCFCVDSSRIQIFTQFRSRMKGMILKHRPNPVVSEPTIKVGEKKNVTHHKKLLRQSYRSFMFFWRLSTNMLMTNREWYLMPCHTQNTNRGASLKMFSSLKRGQML